jgi:transcriptional regulator
VYDSDRYRAKAGQADELLERAQHGILVACSSGGWPQVSILPYFQDAPIVWAHCVQADPTCEALRANERCTFFVNDFLAFTPHDWVGPDDAGRATLNFQAVALECRGRVLTEPEDVAEVLRRTMERYEPGATYTPVTDGKVYGPRLRQLAAVRLEVVAVHAKFKTGPSGPPELKAHVAERLRQRGRPGDERAADVIDPGGGPAQAPVEPARPS